MHKFLSPSTFQIRLTEGEDPVTSPPPPPTSPPPPPTSGKKYDDSELNAIIKKEKDKLTAKTKDIETRYNQLLESKTLSDAEREEINQRLESLQNESKTKEELHQDALKKLQTKYETDTTKYKETVNQVESRFTNLLVNNTLMSAATAPGIKAYNPEQIVEFLKTRSRRVEILSEDGKPTGEFGVKVKLEIKKDGKRTPLDLDADEAVRIMKEQPEWANFFIDPATPGLGGGQGDGNSRTPDLSKMTQAEYEKHRQKIFAAVDKKK